VHRAWAARQNHVAIQFQGIPVLEFDLQIVGFEKIREIAWEPWSSGTIPRRFCTASVRVSDGKWHQINYSIIEDAGMFGSGYGVEWCVVGLDRNWAYNPSADGPDRDRRRG